MNKFCEYIKKYDILILVILGLLLYFPSFFYDFVYDDVGFLLQNEYLNGSTKVHFFDFFKPNYIMPYIYNPLTFILQWLIIKVFGDNSFVFHFVNIFFYISSSIVLFCLLKKIINNYSIVFFAVILYLLHPCHIECTAWVGAVGYNIAVLFFYLSFLYFILAFDENKKINYIYSVVFYILAILSQPIAVTLPAVLLFWVFCFRGERLKESIKYIFVYLPFLFLYLYLYYISVLKTERFEGNLNYTFLEKVSICGFDLFNSIIPIKLSIMYSLPSLSFIIPLFVFVILFYFFRKNSYYLFFCAFGIICILPYSNLFFNINIPIADRYLLLSSVSSCVLISYLSFYLFEKLKDKKVVRYISFIFFIFLYFFSFCNYLPIWKDDNILWRYSYNLNPDNLYVALRYSFNLYKEGKYDDVLILVDNIIEKSNKTSEVWSYNIQYSAYKLKINACIKKGLLQEALTIALKVKELEPNFFDTYLCLIDIYVELKDYDKVIESFNIANNIVYKQQHNKHSIYVSLNKKKMIVDYILAKPDEFIESLKIISKDFKLLEDKGEFIEILNKKDYKSREKICLNYLKKYNNTEYSKSVISLLISLYMQEVYGDNSSKIMRSILTDMDKAEVLLKQGDFVLAEKIYLDILSKNKYIYIAYKNLGILYLHKNRQNDAKQMFNKMLEINPNDEQIKQFIIDYCT